MYGFCLRQLWIIGFQRVMGYVSNSPTYQLGHSRILWGFGEYGLLEVWVMRELTVYLFSHLYLRYSCLVVMSVLLCSIIP
jgi:hypothetical protein